MRRCREGPESVHAPSDTLKVTGAFHVDEDLVAAFEAVDICGSDKPVLVGGEFEPLDEPLPGTPKVLNKSILLSRHQQALPARGDCRSPPFQRSDTFAETGGGALRDGSMSIFDVLREVAELVRRNREVPLAVIQQQFALSDHDLATIVAELTGPRGEATVDNGVLVAGNASAEPVESLQRGETEQRDLTVLFCDLVGSTELSTRLDAEDFSEAIRAYYDQVTAVVGRYGGHVANLMGDGLLVLFGYPQAHDDTERQAVAAALAALAAVGEHGSDFEIRIGLHVGPVVVSNIGPGGRAGALALGETVNVAARVQSAAEPGRAYISDDLARLVDGWFQLEPVGERLFKGLSVPMLVSRVVGSTGARSAIEARRGRGLRSAAGRETELATISDAWARVQQGSGRVVALIGEPGIGKSRLIEEVRREVTGDTEWLAGGCSPYSTATALTPLPR